MTLKIFIIAGEASGDRLGAKLIKSLKKQSKQKIKLLGIGGQLMEKEGVKSLFPISQISLMGFAEVVPHIFKVKKLIKHTANTANTFKPDIVITIDSPGFCFRVIKLLKKRQNSKFVHYISPSVWAYKGDRVNLIAKYYDLVLSVLPFEKKYYKDLPVSCEYIGHPIAEDGWNTKSSKTSVKELYNIDTKSKILGVMAGSRKSEIQRLLPTLIESINLFSKSNQNITAVFPAATKAIYSMIKNNVNQLHCPTKIIKMFELEEKNRIIFFKAFDAAIVKSGTSSLELTFANVPMIVIYKMHLLSFLIVKYYFRIFKRLKFASLTNILLNKEVIPEYIQDNCTSTNLSQGLHKIFDKDFARKQKTGYSKTVKLLSRKDGVLPSEKAAQLILT